MMRARCAWLLRALCCAVCLVPAAQAAVHASVDSTSVGAGESVQLTLQLDRQTSEQPDLAPLAQDFDVLSTSRSTRVQVMNGSLSALTQLQISLAPKHAGQLLIPPLVWAGERSTPVAVTVAPPGTAAPGGAGAGMVGKIFVETTVDDREPFVQAAVNVTVRIYTAEHLYQAGLEFAGNDDVLVQQVGGDRNRTVEKNGQTFDAVERHYVLFPQRSGAITLPGAVLAAQVAVRVDGDRLRTDPFADLFGGNGGMVAGAKPVRIHGDPVVLNVKPRPANFPATYWLPAQSLEVSGQWRPDGSDVHVGEPVTLDLHLQASGLTAAQLPDAAALLHPPAGLKAYPDQAKLDNGAQGDLVIGKRDQSIALIADRAGSFELPAIRVQWWDTKTAQVRESVLPGRTLTILPAVTGGGEVAAAAAASAVGEASTVPRGEPAASRGVPWMWVSLVMALAWLATAGIWWWSRRTRSPRAAPAPPVSARTTSPASARAEFLAACRRNDPQTARRALLAWADAVWRDPAWAAGSAPHGLTAVAARLADERIVAALGELDRACYAGASWDGAALAAVLTDLPAYPAKTKSGPDDIAPLYR